MTDPAAVPGDASPVELRTARLRLWMPPPSAAPLALDYVERNRAHLAPWGPPHPEDFYTEAYWRERLAQNRRELADDRALRLFLSPGDARTGTIVGEVNFTQVVRGAFQACHLGYSIDRDHEGRGLMTEALRAALAHVFDAFRIHRVMANHLPTNERSARLLRRLGFVVEGYARDYLWVGGAWRDHVLTSLTAPSSTRGG